MKKVSSLLTCCAATFAFLLTLVNTSEVQAQYEYRWLNIGEMHSVYGSGGAVDEQAGLGDNPGIRYPAIDRNSGNNRAQGIWTGARNFTDETGRTFPYKVTALGPRATIQQYFPQEQKTTGRFLTQVFVDNALSFQRSVVLDEENANLASERSVYSRFNNRMGLEFEQTAHAWSQEYHDNYHIIEFKVTNTGNIDEDPEAELSSDLEDVYIFYLSRISMHNASAWINEAGQAWGKHTMNDAVGDGFEDYGVDFRAQFAWFGRAPQQGSWNTIGGPMMRQDVSWAAEDDTTGRLASAQMAGRVYIHVDTAPGNTTDDPGQPAMMRAWGQDSPLLNIDEFDDEQMRRQYTEILEAGRDGPSHAYIVQADGDFLYGTNDPNLGVDEGGFGIVEAFGPYDIGMGETINFVVAEGAAGLDKDARLQIGTQYKQNTLRTSPRLPEETPITWNGISMSKNEWALSTRDSLFETFERAIANYNSGYNIPDPPLPPSTFNVNSGPDKITLTWEMFAGDPGGFEIWRAARRYDNPNGYTKQIDLPGSARLWEDTTAERGIEYYYYIQSVAATPNTDATAMTPTGVVLKSNRHHTQTFLPAFLTRPPGAQLSDIRVVPNPYSLAQENTLRWPDQQDKIGFLDIPGQCTISIYTQLGELVKRLEHTNGSGDEYWNLTTDANQVIVSGIYIAVIKDNSKGSQVIRKFSVVR